MDEFKELRATELQKVTGGGNWLSSAIDWYNCHNGDCNPVPTATMWSLRFRQYAEFMQLSHTC
jgi:bacteriocin-like protein